MNTHSPDAVYTPESSHGYPWLPVCSCGWKYPIRYASSHAARTMAEEHAAAEEPQARAMYAEVPRERHQDGNR